MLGIDAGRALEDLDDGLLARNLQHLAAALRAVGQRQVDDLRVAGELRGKSVSGWRDLRARCVRTLTLSRITRGPFTADTVR